MTKKKKKEREKVVCCKVVPIKDKLSRKHEWTEKTSPFDAHLTFVKRNVVGVVEGKLSR